MCKVIEDMRTQERKEAMIDTAKRMIADGILTVDFDKLEQRIFDKTVVKCS